MASSCRVQPRRFSCECLLVFQIGNALTYSSSIKLHMFYSAHENWKELTSPSLGLHFPVLQRYLRLNKIRQSYKSRLEVAGLWSLPEIEIEQEKRQKWGEGPGRRWEEPSVSKKKEVKTRDKFLQVFEREKVGTLLLFVIVIHSPIF